MCATAGAKNTARKRPAERPARRRASAAGGRSRRTRITSVGRNTWRECGSGGRPIRGIGARTGAAGRLRYKTLWWCKQLKILKIFLAVRYKTRFDAKVLF